MTQSRHKVVYSKEGV